MEVPSGYDEQQLDERRLPTTEHTDPTETTLRNQATGLAQGLNIDMIGRSLNSLRTHVLPPLSLDMISTVTCCFLINIDIVYISDPDLNTQFTIKEGRCDKLPDT